MKTRFHLRPARADDATGAAQVVRAVYDEYGFLWEEDGYHADLYNLDTHYLRAGHGFWIAELEGRTVGTVGLEVFAPVSGPAGQVIAVAGKRRIAGCDCSLERLYVRREARGQGIGQALLQRAVLAAQSRGCRMMEIWSDKRFQEAHSLYQKLGAIIVGERICDDPDVSPEWGLRFPLGTQSTADLPNRTIE